GENDMSGKNTVIIVLVVLLLIAAVSVVSCAGGKKYQVDYHGQTDLFKGAKASYAAGKHVTLRFDMIATDTDYSFYVDGEAVNASWENNAYVIRFVMPDHDTEVYFSAVNSMTVSGAFSEYYPEITSFRYSYSNPFGGCGYFYKVRRDEDDRITFTCYMDEYRDFGEMTCEISDTVCEDLRKILEECDLIKWDGFHESDPDVLDGDGFSLDVYFADECSIRASGSNAFPSGYPDFVTRLDALFAPFTEELLKVYENAPRPEPEE
ncbi:MAG: hypothetical protein MJ175_07250, partial [Clostridia bacterium]|nr:hypothetical protein [Clostridia bacterium]